LCRSADAADTETIAQLVNRAARSRSGVDLAVVLDNVEPPTGWLARMQACAARESTVATVSALSSANAVAGKTVFARPESALVDGDVGFPRIDLPVGACVLIARDAFDLLGGLDETMPTSAAALADFGLRARRLGLANLLAGDVVVAGARPLSDRDRAELASRHGTLWLAAQDPPSAAVERSVALARAALARLSVTVDARSLGGHGGGTQVYALELTRALAATGEIDLRVLIGPDAQAKELLEGLDLESVITYEDALEGPRRTDLVHRPQQVFSLDDLALLRPLGDRLVITHLDLIAYHNPTYFQGLDEWRRHVRVTRIAFDVADHLLFFSRHALTDASREDLLDAHRASVVPLGIRLDAADAPMARPTALSGRDEPFLLCIGADYAHKNRPFALELTAELRRVHDWAGTIVLAGAHVAHGSSATAEQSVIASNEELADAVIDLGPISDAERSWLMARAGAVVYPTVLEGFGLVPFEAAAAGVPCLFAWQSSLADLLPAELATLDGWDLQRVGAAVAELLTDSAARTAHVATLRRACGAYDWARCAEQTIEVYRQTLAAPGRSSARHAWESLEREREIVRLDRAVSDTQDEHRMLLEDLGADGLALVGPGGLLSAADRRALLALAARPALSRPVFAANRAGYRLARIGKARQ
jgi:glycosyltransferase involved in cell wall biosynthesis